ncbi:MAG: hypothetical protein HY835_04995, partial [Anaerolineae bacterium]|nr:hypothetical protein [Anaerolineae bacterium]
AFAFGQTAAARLLMSRPERLPEPSFILSRRIDQGTSVREDGADHSYLWAGQTALESWHLASALPGMPGLTEGLVRNFLATGDDDLPDFRPGLGGQRTHLLCQPLLASLVVRHASPAFYAEAYPTLLRLFQAWMSEERDPDGDALPTWQHPIQTGLESIPTYDRWHAQAQGLNIQYLETPTLGALLYREARSLTEMAGSLERADDIPWLEAQAARIQAAVERMWDRRERIYRYRDAVTHTSRAGKEILAFNGSGEYPLKRKPNHPSRLVVQVTAREESTRAAILHITGVDENDAPLEEHLLPRDFTWSSTSGRATTRNVFRQVTRVEVNGLMEGDAGHILAADHSGEDLSLFLPLWAGIPDAARAKIILERNLLPRYAGPFGLPICPPDDCPEEPRELHCAALPWNALIADGLITAGYRREAADLILRMLNAVIAELRQGHTFRQFYDVNSGAGVGERGHLWGLPPLGLFLRAAGLDRISPTEVLVRGFNPFPWPITVKYQRMTVTRDGDTASIVLPGRPPVTVSGLQPQRISLT